MRDQEAKARCLAGICSEFLIEKEDKRMIILSMTEIELDFSVWCHGLQGGYLKYIPICGLHILKISIRRFLYVADSDCGTVCSIFFIS